MTIFLFPKAIFERVGFRWRKIERSIKEAESGIIHHHVTPPPRGHKGGGGVLKGSVASC